MVLTIDYLLCLHAQLATHKPLSGARQVYLNI